MRRASAVSIDLLTVIAMLLAMSIQAKISLDCPMAWTNVTELKQPIFLTNLTGKMEFYLPRNNSLEFSDKQQFLVTCPNPRNILTNSNANMTVGQCTSGKLKVAGKVYDSLELLQCNKSIRGDVRKTNARCGNNQGYSTQIGYYVGRRLDFLPLIETCYDRNQGATLYSAHNLHGESIKSASRSRYRPGFSSHGSETGVSIAYKQSFQKATFTNLLGSSKLAEKYINSKSYLSRGHLAPDADFLFAAWQFSTYFYLNACPQWQAVNGGNWHKVESMVRKVSAEIGEPLRVFTGTHGVLHLPHQNGTLIGMYLLPKFKLPVPSVTWKLVFRPATGEAIILLGSNNPFSIDEKICQDVCAQYGWSHANWKIPDKGIVYCCEYNEFAQNVSFVPFVKVKSALRGPKGH